MRTITICCSAVLLALAPACMAQEWEVGGLGGYGFQTGLSAKNAAGSAATGFKSGGTWGAVGGQNMHRRLGGEIRYEFRWGDAKVSSGGQEAAFRAHAHLIHYDLLYHFADKGSKVRVFVAAGGGAKVIRGTGAEQAYQPLNQFVLLTKTREILPMASLGGGVKVRLNEWLMLRAEVRDFLTPPPQKILAPAPGAQISGWLHDIVPMVGLHFTIK